MGWGGDRGDREFSFMGWRFGALCRWIGVVIGVIGNFLSWGGVLGLCADEMSETGVEID